MYKPTISVNVSFGTVNTGRYVSEAKSLIHLLSIVGDAGLLYVGIVKLLLEILELINKVVDFKPKRRLMPD